MAVGDKLFVADKQTLEAVKALIGANTDPAGNATVFARLAQIAAYVDQVEGNTDTIESSLVTALADLLTIKGFTDTLEANLGSNASVANPAGDLHAKVKDIKATLAGLDGTAYIGKFSTANTTYTTALDVTGPGILTGATFTVPGNNALSPHPRVTIDGTVIADDFQGTMTLQGSGFFTQSPIGSANIHFNSSLKIELYTSNVSNHAVVNYSYVKK